ncbi:Holliday junction endonuclease [Streptomyces spectabilis]|uniref:Holliday junction endonuclease n=1 Tax=Streptomyces spectabilis TaxID=68270 RepID=A0A5P2XK82_STRST|nr:Holliday junction endonuclease [Streptomyces spectabilis]
MRVIGLELSITETGVALPDGDTYPLAPDQQDGDGRLVGIAQSFDDLLASPIHLAVIEDLPKHAHAAGITGMVHTRLALLEAGVPYAVVAPATLKAFATGKGTADKTAMALAACKRAGAEFADDNCCDAWWLRAAGLDWHGQPVCRLPVEQRARLAKVAWPALSVGREVAS